MEFYKKTEQFMIDAFTKVENQNDIVHHQRTVYWILQLKPDASEELLTAGVAHDIERAFYGDWKKGSSNPDALRKHQDLSASEIEKFLRKENAPAEFIERVKHLVAYHEEGGDEDLNVLCDADCLAFFELKIQRRIERMKERGNTNEEIKANLDYYFSRIISDRAKVIAKKWYNEALEKLKEE